jgi:hypothetical protein
MTAAGRLPNLSDEMTHQLDFWHGFSIYQAVIPEQEALTLETANATLPRFQEVLQLLANTGEYAATVDVDFPQLLENVRMFIEIQETVIRRGRSQ